MTGDVQHDHPAPVAVEPLGRTIRLAVLISGGGTTLTNLVERIADGRLDAEIPLVIASRECAGIKRAEDSGLNCERVDRKTAASVEAFSKAIFDRCREERVDLVLMGGFLSLLEIPPDYHLRVMNIHPSLIPAFCGRGFHGERVHRAVIDQGVKVTGCTVHFADNHYDNGPIIVQQCVNVADDDTPQSLAARVFAVECELYPRAIRLFAEGRLTAVGRRVLVRSDDV